ncbi:MAG: hypothetical protein KME52_27300 [Desmonostoc geniculatum HA4340-LM1]|jgi:hypothetical protein|nr:hypothetical protein [Desmonostoc geniculatum HA4340-LM1]
MGKITIPQNHQNHPINQQRQKLFLRPKIKNADITTQSVLQRKLLAYMKKYRLFYQKYS